MSLARLTPTASSHCRTFLGLVSAQVASPSAPPAASEVQRVAEALELTVEQASARVAQRLRSDLQARPP